jgi:hypothetical protein
MTISTAWLKANSLLLIRATLKALIFFAMFNLGYFLAQPLQTGRLPTLYNTLVPGLLRFRVGDEYNINRLLADHSIRSASPDHYNVVILGSSEIWGVTVAPSQTIPAYLDQLGLKASDGRPVRIYNLSFPGPEILKDFFIWESLRGLNRPIDLVILTVNNGALARDTPHQLLTENGERVLDILDTYGLPHSLLIGEAHPQKTTFWQDRQDLANWFKGQMQTPLWLFARQDRPTIPAPLPAQTAFFTREAITPSLRDGVLEAFARSTSEAHVPLLVMLVPLASINDPFENWIITEAAHAALPVLDCAAVLTEPSLFEGSVHLMPSTHPLFAQILGQSLSQPDLVSLSADLPLHVPDEAEDEPNICSFHPAP